MQNNIHLLILDVDGVLTDGKLWYNAKGEELKCFHVHDGLGIKRLIASGITVAVISARHSKAVEQRLNELGVSRYFLGQKDKLLAYEQLKTELNITNTQIAYVGDDLPDLPVMQQVGLPIAVANAQPEIAAVALHQTTKAGGDGGVREACEFLLQRQRENNHAHV